MEEELTHKSKGGDQPSDRGNAATSLAPSSLSSDSLYSGEHRMDTPAEDNPDDAAIEFPRFDIDSPSLDDSAPPSERPSSTNLQAAYRASISNPGAGGTVRVVTPDHTDGTSPVSSALEHGHPQTSRGLASQHSSPRSMPGGPSRRQGMVFHDEDFEEDGEYEGGRRAPSIRIGETGPRKMRVRTMETPFVNQRSAPPELENRHRVGSQSSSGSHVDDGRLLTSPMSTVLHSFQNDSSPGRPPKGKEKDKDKDKDKKSKKLLKSQQASRSKSPLVVSSPSVDVLPVPVRTTDPNKMILLMTTLCGKMKGEVEYQGDSGVWYTGVAYIDEERFCLMLNPGMNGPFHIPLIFDLRGCRVLPVEYPEERQACLELVSLHPSISILLRPIMRDELEFWLAALLCWQQVRPPMPKAGSNKQSSHPLEPVRPDLKRLGRSAEGKPTAIIKVGNASLWDKGLTQSARSLIKRSPTRDIRSPYASWRPISCTLHDNGDLRFFVEHEDVPLAVIEMSQLSRGAIQELDPSVLDEEHCIAIFPLYASKAEKLSIFRPVYIALENRVQFEVWFVLLRAFAAPDIYQLHEIEEGNVQNVEDLQMEYSGDVFRLHKMIKVRVIEAKVRALPSHATDSPTPDKQKAGGSEKSSRKEADLLVGNYLAEVVLGQTVRARTTTKADTKNPFWREDCEFIGLPPSTPSLSVVLKRAEGNLDSLTNQIQASYGLPKLSNIREIVCGSVELEFASLKRNQDHEQWLQILDENQQSIGSMLIKVSHNDHVILLLREYQELSDLLHHFPNGLTTLISSVVPGQLRYLSEIFLNIFQVSGSASDWLMALVEDEIDGIGQQSAVKYRFGSRLKSSESIDSTSDRELIVRDMSKNLAGEANLLFRGNTLLTQSLEFHMRRLGGDFLKETLQAKIFEVNEINPDCEVDPAKLQQSGGDVDQHWNQLILLTTEIWQCVADSIDRIPAELRHILKYIRAVAEDRYGDFLRTVAYTSVSGFLFLRFVCPAILSPKLFGLLRDHPRPRAQRTFTLVAKALQKLANLSTFGKREEYMEPMNKFLNTQRPKFKEYIDQVCDIPTERAASTLPANYSTPLTILGRLPPIAREGFPSLPYLIDQAYFFAAMLKIWHVADPLAKRESPDPNLVEFNELAMALANRSVACRRAVEAQETDETADNELAELLEQATLIESLNLSSANNLPNTNALNSHFQGDFSHPGNSGGDGAEDVKLRRRRSHEVKKSPSPGVTTSSSWRLGDKEKEEKPRHISVGGSIKGRNVRVGKTILNGIMRIGGSGRSESPEGKSK